MEVYNSQHFTSSPLQGVKALEVLVLCVSLLTYAIKKSESFRVTSPLCLFAHICYKEVGSIATMHTLSGTARTPSEYVGLSDMSLSKSWRRRVATEAWTVTSYPPLYISVMLKLIQFHWSHCTPYMHCHMCTHSHSPPQRFSNLYGELNTKRYTLVHGFLKLGRTFMMLWLNLWCSCNNYSAISLFLQEYATTHRLEVDLCGLSDTES